MVRSRAAPPLGPVFLGGKGKFSPKNQRLDPTPTLGKGVGPADVRPVPWTGVPKGTDSQGRGRRPARSGSPRNRLAPRPQPPREPRRVGYPSSPRAPPRPTPPLSRHDARAPSALPRPSAPGLGLPARGVIGKAPARLGVRDGLGARDLADSRATVRPRSSGPEPARLASRPCAASPGAPSRPRPSVHTAAARRARVRRGPARAPGLAPRPSARSWAAGVRSEPARARAEPAPHAPGAGPARWASDHDPARPGPTHPRAGRAGTRVLRPRLPGAARRLVEGPVVVGVQTPGLTHPLPRLAPPPRPPPGSRRLTPTPPHGPGTRSRSRSVTPDHPGSETAPLPPPFRTTWPRHPWPGFPNPNPEPRPLSRVRKP